MATIWVVGDLILGLFVLLTRGNTVIIEETGSRLSNTSDGPSMDDDGSVGGPCGGSHAAARSLLARLVAASSWAFCDEGIPHRIIRRGRTTIFRLLVLFFAVNERL
jgi:hypothetical protein